MIGTNATGTVEYAVRHVTQFTYSAPISESIMEVRMQPRTGGGQHCLRFELSTTPRTRPFTYRDARGNIVHHFDIPRPHARLTIVAEALVAMTPREPLPDCLPLSAWDDLRRGLDTDEQAEAVRPSGFARATPLLDDFRGELGLAPSLDPLTLLRQLTSQLYERFAYTPNATRVDSPIDDALRSRAGVCQDFAHIMIALVRGFGIPCRYVSGYLSPNPDAPDRSLAGVTHAWVEAWLPDLGWVGFDPTNNVIAGPRHIVVAIGRDYSDVPPTRGVFRGEASSELAVAVAVALANQPLAADEPVTMATWRSPDAGDGAALDDDYAQQQQ